MFVSSTDMNYIKNIMMSVDEYTDKLYFPLVILKETIICYYGLNVADDIQFFQDAIN